MKNKETGLADPFEFSPSSVPMPAAFIERERTVFPSADIKYQKSALITKVDYEDGSEFKIPHIAWDYTRSGDKVDPNLAEDLFNPYMMANKRTVIIDGEVQTGNEAGRGVRYLELFPAPRFNLKGEIKGYDNGFRLVDFSVSPTDGLSVAHVDSGTYKHGEVLFGALQNILKNGIDAQSPVSNMRLKVPSFISPRRIAIGIEGIAPTRHSGADKPLDIFNHYAQVVEKISFEKKPSPQKLGRFTLRHS